MNLHQPCFKVVWKPSRRLQIVVSLPKWVLIGLLATLLGAPAVGRLISAFPSTSGKTQDAASP
jgi:hypothetical protein